jgi:hypothetical protein
MPIRVNIRVDSSRIRQQLLRLSQGINGVGDDWEREAAELVLERARPKVPYDMEILRDSGEVVRNTRGGYSVVFQEMRGDFDIALWTHEAGNPGVKGDRSTYTPQHEGTGRKYLENALTESRDEIRALAQAQIQNLLGIRRRRR